MKVEMLRSNSSLAISKLERNTRVRLIFMRTRKRSLEKKMLKARVNTKKICENGARFSGLRIVFGKHPLRGAFMSTRNA